MRQSKKTWVGAVFLTTVALQGCTVDDSEASDRGHDQGGIEAADSGSAALARYVGEVADSDVRVAVIHDGEKARLFFCGGPDSVGSATHWFNVTLTDGQVSVSEAGFALRAQFDPDAVSGEFTVQPGAAKTFALAPVAERTVAGLYEGLGACGRLALIARQETPDAEIAVQGACVGGGHDPEQVNPITPLVFSTEGIRVQAPGKADSVLLQQAALQPL